MTEPFWKEKTLLEMSQTEWESLCDGCGKCCLLKLQDEDSGVVDYTDVACRLLDIGACRCKDYENRQAKVHDCVRLTPDKVAELKWMPSTCAYRLLSEGKELYWWHPLLSGDPESVHRAGISVRGRAVPEGRVPERRLLKHIVKWPE